MLVVGSDERPGLDGARGDALHVIGLNPGLGGPRCSTSRGTRYVTIPGHGQGRINEAYQYGGPPLQARTVQALTGAPISYVLTTTFVGLVGMVDALGGLEVDVPVPHAQPQGRHRLLAGPAVASEAPTSSPSPATATPRPATSTAPPTRAS